MGNEVWLDAEIEKVRNCRYPVVFMGTREEAGSALGYWFGSLNIKPEKKDIPELLDELETKEERERFSVCGLCLLEYMERGQLSTFPVSLYQLLLRHERVVTAVEKGMVPLWGDEPGIVAQKPKDALASHEFSLVAEVTYGLEPTYDLINFTHDQDETIRAVKALTGWTGIRQTWPTKVLGTVLHRSSSSTASTRGRKRRCTLKSAQEGNWRTGLASYRRKRSRRHINSEGIDRG